eukprot:3678928-Prymnesium_polylepis.1
MSKNWPAAHLRCILTIAGAKAFSGAAHEQPSSSPCSRNAHLGAGLSISIYLTCASRTFQKTRTNAAISNSSTSTRTSVAGRHARGRHLRYHGVQSPPCGTSRKSRLFVRILRSTSSVRWITRSRILTNSAGCERRCACDA